MTQIVMLRTKESSQVADSIVNLTDTWVLSDKYHKSKPTQKLIMFHIMLGNARGRG